VARIADADEAGYDTEFFRQRSRLVPCLLQVSVRGEDFLIDVMAPGEWTSVLGWPRESLYAFCITFLIAIVSSLHSLHTFFALWVSGRLARQGTALTALRCTGPHEYYGLGGEVTVAINHGGTTTEA